MPPSDCSAVIEAWLTRCQFCMQGLPERLVFVLQVWALLLEKTHPRLATDVIYVAGDRVVSGADTNQAQDGLQDDGFRYSEYSIPVTLSNRPAGRSEP